MLKWRRNKHQNETVLYRSNNKKNSVVDSSHHAHEIPKDDGAGQRWGARRLALKRIFRLISVLGIAGIMVLTVLFGYRHATTSQYFSFNEIHVEGCKRLDEKSILSATGLSFGTNIFDVDVAQATQRLLEHPWIMEASVRRKLPGCLNIRITERRAVAMANLDVLYLLDDLGKVFKRWVRGDPIPSPVISGVSREQFLDDRKTVDAIFLGAIDLAARYRKSGLHRLVPLAEIHAEPDGGFSLTVGTDPTYVRFGRGPYRSKLARLSTLLSALQRDGKRPAVIYFDNEIRPDRITVKLKGDQPLQSEAAIENFDTYSQKRVSKI